MKLSIVIICWNDSKVIENCLRSIFDSEMKTEFEVIVCDNGSTDQSIDRVRTLFPAARVIENGANLGFSKGNNVGIREASGHYILILNPDTIVHPGSLDRWIEFADNHPGDGAFGCKVLNPDGTYQGTARPFPTIRRAWIAALGLRPLGFLGRAFLSDKYVGWNGDREREIDWQSGCCILFRGEVLKSLGGFDDQFFFHYEEVDLCYRVWKSGHSIRFTPTVTITHLGGRWVERFPIRLTIETTRNCYRYYYKHFGPGGALKCRRVTLAKLRIRQLIYGLSSCVRPSESVHRRLELYRSEIDWNTRLDPVAFIENGAEPNVPIGDSVSVSS